jgi:hypothetical protein
MLLSCLPLLAFGVMAPGGRRRSRPRGSQDGFVREEDFQSSEAKEEAFPPDSDSIFIKLIPQSLPKHFQPDFCSIPGQLNKNFNERPELVQIVNMPCAIFVEKPEDETLEAFSRRLAKPCGKLVSKLETPQATVGESMILIMQASSKCVVKAGVTGSKLGPSWS